MLKKHSRNFTTNCQENAKIHHTYAHLKNIWSRCISDEYPRRVWGFGRSRKIIHPASKRKVIYLGRAIDGTLLTPLSAIASQQGSPKKDTMNRTKHFLDYMATQENAVLTYHTSDMILAVHSDAGYNNIPKARSRVGDPFLCQTIKTPPYQMVQYLT